ncbi:SAM-dependent methyltransferase [Methylophaga thiooxydans]|uniref:SAM-dependent methyltransferase n=1 Tax=Methylophaga thiooxydans TaxID=392484 RepID=A0A0A0BHV0_9GAMM|nr:class I SAM-dependent methyltransferase [Methylophaga thiooxydans]KGM07541.1 SAM-dependent methyltransferase [Methylophaga thiooxydans]
MKSTTSTELLFSSKYDETHAQAYFEKHHDGFWRKLSDWRDKHVARKALKIAGEPPIVLDVPCGTGRFWPVLAEHEERTILACDLSQAMIDTGLKLRDPIVTEQVVTLQSSAFDIHLESNSVHSVFCIRLLHHLGKSDDRLRLLRELHRVTRSTVIISLWVDGNFKAWKRQKLEQERTQRDYQNRFVIPREVAEQEFREAGFNIKAHIDFLPKYAMWRTYVLEKNGAGYY